MLVGGVDRQGHDGRRRAMAAAGRSARDQAAHEGMQGLRRERMMLELDVQVVGPAPCLLDAVLVAQRPDRVVVDRLPCFEQLDRAVDPRHVLPPLARVVSGKDVVHSPAASSEGDA